MPSNLSFKVRSSSGEGQYNVVATTSGPLTITCSCEAGRLGTICKHRMDLVDGVVSACVGLVDADVDQLRARVSASKLAEPLRRLASLAFEAERIKREIAGTKKQIARLMSQGC